MRLQDKFAIITGATGNIGKATALRFLEEGASVFLVDRNRDALDAFTQEVTQQFGGDTSRIGTFVGDVSSPDSVQASFAAACAGGQKVDVFFANAGIEGPLAAPGQYDDDGFKQVMDINAGGVFYGVKYVEPYLVDGASVIITSSVAGLRGHVNTIGYAASKHAVVGIMRSAARAFGHRRIRVNSVHPGMVDSDMYRRIQNTLAERGVSNIDRAYLESVPIKAFVQPLDVANAVVFLAGDESRMITGQTLSVDAGYLL